MSGTAIVKPCCDTCTGVQQLAQSTMAAAGQSAVQAFLVQAKQQLPSLAKDLTAIKLQDFLCTTHRLQHPVSPSIDGALVVPVSICMLLLLMSAAYLLMLIDRLMLPAVYGLPGFCGIVASARPLLLELLYMLTLRT